MSYEDLIGEENFSDCEKTSKIKNDKLYQSNLNSLTELKQIN